MGSSDVLKLMIRRKNLRGTAGEIHLYTRKKEIRRRKDFSTK